MKTGETERLAKIILENAMPRPARLKILAPQPQGAKADRERLRQMKRQFDERYSISTPPELIQL